MDNQQELFDAHVPTPQGATFELRALTLWQPWAHAITHLGKRVENRPWAPWRSIVGKVIALHAAAKVDLAEEALAVQWITKHIGATVPSTPLPHGAIVALARVMGSVTTSADPWFFGPYGWILDDVIVLPTPIACRGMQGLWPVPADVAVQVLAAGVRRG